MSISLSNLRADSTLRKWALGFLAIAVLLLAPLTQAFDGDWMADARKGDALSQYYMGNAYAQGYPEAGIPQDSRQAFIWYLKAAKQGHSAAQYQVAAAYILGEGTKKNMAQARQWLKKASAQGHKDAVAILKSMGPASTTATGADSPGSGFRLEDISLDKIIDYVSNFSLDSLSLDSISIDPLAMLDAILAVDIFGSYWPWWLGGIALGFITVAFWLAMRSTLGMSSSYDRIVSWRDDAMMNKAATALQGTPSGVLESAMMSATMDEFGDDMPDEMLSAMQAEAEVAAPTVAASPPMPAAGSLGRVPWPAHVTFLLFTVIGGFLAAFAGGNFEVRMDMGASFTRFFTDGPMMWGVLAGGGFLIGFGTRMGGGCTSGHGLSGCSRLQPGSLLGTASFFGTAIAVSIAMDMYL